MNTAKRHAWPRWVAVTALVAGVSLAAGAGVIAQPLAASSSVASQRTAAVPLDMKDATISKLGNKKETTLKESASKRPDKPDKQPRDKKTLPGKRGAIDPAKELKKLSTQLGGCLSAYGDAGQCLPVVPPSAADHIREMVDAGLDPKSMSHPWTCSELRQYFPQGIAIRKQGVDPQRLDPDRNGIGCSDGD